MKKKASFLNIVRFGGAYVAYLIGSGFASGQEILQFYTGYGLPGIFAVLISAVLFIWVGVAMMQIGYDHRNEADFHPCREVCGKVLGVFYEIVTYIYLFSIVVVMISGAGASLSEYLSVNHYVGVLLMAVLVFAAIIFGLRRLVDTIGFIGPVVACFAIAVGVITLLRSGGIHLTPQELAQASLSTPTRSFVGGGLLYAAYNVFCAILFFSALGGQAASKKEASLGAVFGGGLLSLTILLMDLAFLSRLNDVKALEIPTLYLASSISPVMGGFFLVTLLGGIFSTAAPMSWTVCDKISPEGSSQKRRVLTALGVVAAGCVCGLMPFGKLVGIIYPISGYMGLAFLLCLLVYRIRRRFIKTA